MNKDEMPAGRDLDALVAEKIMGWTNMPAPPIPEDMAGRTPDDEIIDLPRYSTDIAAAWTVVIKIKESHQVCLVLEDYQFDGKYWEACFKGKFDESTGKWTKLDYAFADTPELAICRAALKVITNE